MSQIYDLEFQKIARKAAASLDIDLMEGVYLQLTGPQYESPQEIAMCRTLGADAVGMSTACEAIAARHMACASSVFPALPILPPASPRSLCAMRKFRRQLTWLHRSSKNSLPQRFRASQRHCKHTAAGVCQKNRPRPLKTARKIKERSFLNTRFYNAKILVLDAENHFSIAEDELHVTGDTITYIGPGRKADPDAAETTVFDREIDARGNLLIPGFKNAHNAHPDDLPPLLRGRSPAPRMARAPGLPERGKARRGRRYWLNILGIMEYLTSGITSNFDMYIQQKNSIAATVDTGFRTVLTSGLNNFVDSPEILEEMYNYVNELSDRTSYLLGFHAEYTTGGPLLEAVAKLAEKYHSPVWTHNAETKSEVEGCKERWGLTPTQLMERLGMFQYGGGGYHCIWMEDRDFEIFRDRKLTAVTNPSSNLKLASGICPLKRFYDNGINLAIGTDGPASNNCLDMFREMFLTTGLSKVREMDAAGIPADAILYMATAGGAHAMQLTDCDRLAAGKKADLVMIDLHQPNMQPENNLIKNLVYSGSKQNVKLTMVNGQILYENGEFHIGFDPEEIYARSNAIIRRISGSHADN